MAYDVGEGALHPGSVGPIYHAMIQRAFDRGALPDLTTDDLARLLRYAGSLCACRSPITAT